MYGDRINLIMPHITEREFVLVDWGSDAGWFSVKIANAFPRASVISVEAGLMSDGQNIRLHKEMLNTYGIVNNKLVNTLFGPDTFAKLKTVPSSYQLALSIFHHMGNGFGSYLNSAASWDVAFSNLISGAAVTFLELPNEENPNETPHRVRGWYAGRNLEVVIKSALENNSIGAVVECLGETEHGKKGARKLFKITLNEPPREATAAEIAAHIETIGKRIRIRPARRFRMAASRLLQKLKPTGPQAGCECSGDGPGE